MLPWHNRNNGHVSERHTHAMMRYNFISKWFRESCDDGGGLFLWNGYSTPQQVCTNRSDLISAFLSLSLCLMDLYVCLCILCDTELYLLVNKITMSS